ncbi:hypothetical protein LVD17_15010 [Fulvivirga ulvae]|uniref:hypothetical protein n=1 Tax=Fulvivirga ulvae TaxID=2904245 RepID=UPI001F290222|nr:hypothetical protein [Fulvivirga ulvae]UII29609.1 hypothetical protein LVD17_15010 [Fulvivirga ulvae]
MKDSTITRLYTTDKVYLDFDPAVPCVIAGKFGFVPSDEFRAAMLHSLQLYKEKTREYPALGWVANLNQANVYDPQDTKWMIEHWNPAAINAGLRYIAFVEPESDFVKISIERYTKQSVLREGLVINKFFDTELAKTWLRSQLFDIQ